MTIEKGGSWGTADDVPSRAVEVDDDNAAREIVEDALGHGRESPALLLRGGDLCRTLGGGPDRAVSGVRFAVDVGEVVIDGAPHYFVAHLVARTATWRSAFVAMNAQWVRRWNLGPKAHPGDGLLDTYEIELEAAQLIAVRARAGRGAHLPHPGIQERRLAAVSAEFDHARSVRLDGCVVGRTRTLSLRVIPDALTVYI